MVSGRRVGFKALSSGLSWLRSRRARAVPVCALARDPRCSRGAYCDLLNEGGSILGVNSSQTGDGERGSTNRFQGSQPTMCKISCATSLTGRFAVSIT